MFKLVIQDDEGKTTVVPLIRDEITIGRKEGNTIRLTERNVSRRHARILRNNGEVSIEDLGSYNGIRVNNARIAERVALRVSDQVQIGDYKLYLKAEGVEQVDDARTMPIERVESEKATDIMPAVAPAPTAPVAMPQAPPAAAAAPGLPPNTKLVGSPATTLVAVPDQDGRPIGSAAQVPALTPPTGYGRLVVLSSNFAGKEFELSRGQMIIGRTPENDIAIDHRSISRNHAKVVREPDTGRYTISDLGSANGVRVNGSDYGKIELRRGDVVDLGHVRLRFVEPGEDFVFSRDAVVTDVPESGGRKGLIFAVVLGLLVLVGVGVAWMMKGGGEGDRKGAGPGTGGAHQIDAAPQVALADASNVAPTVDSESGGSAGSADDQLVIECKTHLTNKEWIELSDCAGRLKATNPELAKQFSDTVAREGKNEATLRALRDAIKAVEMDKARKLQAEIGNDSVYTAPAREAIEKKEQQLVASLARDLRSAANAHECGRYEQRARNYDKYGGSIVADAKREVGRCEPRPDNPPRGCTASSCPNGTRCDDGRCVRVAITPPKPDCDPNEVKATEDAGDAAVSRGSYAQAVSEFKKILKCKSSVALKAYLAACRARQFGEAKSLFQRLDKAKQDTYSQICLKEGFDPRVP